MPRHLTPIQTARAIAKLEENWSLSAVAAELHVSKSCIFKLKRRQENGLERLVRAGVGRVSNVQQDNNLVNFVRANPFVTAITARQDTNFPGSVRTARRRIKRAGLKNYAAAKKPYLTDVNKRNRLQFANQFLNQDEEFWSSVVFSDEKRFQSCSDGKIRVYRPVNSRYQDNYVDYNRNSGRFSINVWGWISVHGPGICWKINERFNSRHYGEILEHIMLPSVSQIFPEGFIFQHVIKVCKFLNTKNIKQVSLTG